MPCSHRKGTNDKPMAQFKFWEVNITTNKLHLCLSIVSSYILFTTNLKPRYKRVVVGRKTT